MSVDLVLFNESGSIFNVTEAHSPFHSFLVGGSCSTNGSHCSPYKASFIPGKYKFELWGGANIYHGNGGYVSGELLLEHPIEIFLFVGEYSSKFNSVDIGNSNGTIGNGASDLRLFYDGNWSSFLSLKSRIIVAGGGGNNRNSIIGDPSGVCNISGNYGYSGGLMGYEGFNRSCSSLEIEYNIAHPGHPGSQTSGGEGGFGGLCHIKTGDGGQGSFGIGGKPGRACNINTDYSSTDGYAGSGGYYGSGGSSGGSSGYSSPAGTAGGSSFISGHINCDSIRNESEEHNIIHSGHPWHYSGLYFSHTLMIDGSGRRWKGNEDLILMKMPKPTGSFYSEGIGHSGSGYIRITILSYSICTQHSHYYFLCYLFPNLLYLLS